MKDEENVVSYLLRVDEIVNTIRGLGEKVEELMIVQKVLRSLPLIFDANFSSIEEMKDLDSLTMDELHGILTTYEMRTEKENPSNKEEAFKYSKKIKNREHESSDSSNNESNAEESHFVRKTQKGSGKYKGKLPFKCFNCGKVGYFPAKCPYEKKMKVVMMKKIITLRKRENLIKRVSVKRRKTSISKRKVFTPKRKVAHLKRSMKVSLIVKEKKLFSWP
jgi:hypothetical protein